MKKKLVTLTFVLGTLFFLEAISDTFASDHQKSLADIYQSGRVRFVPEIVLDDDAMPKDVFFEGFEHPSAIVQDGEGNVYIADYAAHHIKKFDSVGKFLAILGREGQGPGEFNQPYTLTFSNGRLVVWDMGNRRFSIITPDGTPVKSRILNRTEEGWPWKFRTLPNGDILLETRKDGPREQGEPQIFELRLYSPEMEYIKTIYTKEIFYRKFIRNPRRSIPQPFAFGVYWDVNKSGQIIIGFSKSYEIEVYDVIKGKVFSFSNSYNPVGVTNQDKKAFFDGIVHSQGGQVTVGAPDYIRKNAEFPKYKPAFNQIMVDSDNNILVSLFRENSAEDYRYFDAFDPQGRFINKVQIIEGGAIPILGGRIIEGVFWEGTSDMEEQIKIVRYRISSS